MKKFKKMSEQERTDAGYIKYVYPDGHVDWILPTDDFYSTGIAKVLNDLGVTIRIKSIIEAPREEHEGIKERR